MFFRHLFKYNCVLTTDTPLIDCKQWKAQEVSFHLSLPLLFSDSYLFLISRQAQGKPQFLTLPSSDIRSKVHAWFPQF